MAPCVDENWRLFVEGAMDEAQPGVSYDDLWPVLWPQKAGYEDAKQAWVNLEGKYSRRKLVSLLNPNANRKTRRSHWPLSERK